MQLYITVETTSRELDAKTFLACLAAAEGFDVLIGQEDMVRRMAEMGAPGIFYDKGLHGEYPEVLAGMRRLGHLTAINEEEGLVVIPERYAGYNLTEAASRATDLHLAWGEYQRSLIRKYRPELAEKSVCVGNVRMDLLRPELRPFHQEEVEEIRAGHGHFVLINTRFGLVNNADDTGEIRRRVEAGLLGPVETMRPFFERDMAMFGKFQDMVRELCARFPDKTFVLRPHPSENIAFWEAMAETRPNLKIRREGNVHKWILASDMVIQSGCSTAVESLLLGVPCVSYLPVVRAEVAHKLSDAVTYNAKDLDELCGCVAGERDADMARLRPRWVETATGYIASMTGPLAAEATVEWLKILAGREIRREIRAEFGYALKKRLGGRLRSWNRLLKQRIKRASGRPIHAAQGKWRPLTTDEFQALARRFAFYDPRFSRLEISRAYPDCFQVRTAGR